MSFISYFSLFALYSSDDIEPTYPKICEAKLPYGYVTIGVVTTDVPGKLLLCSFI